MQILYIAENMLLAFPTYAKYIIAYRSNIINNVTYIRYD
jgi:hypothetical protein